MRKLPTRKLLATIVAGALFIPSTGFALGLGEIEVSSALNQKLRADIELLSATPEDTENIIVKLASRKEFSRAGLDRPYSLSDLRFKAEVIEGVPHIKVSTSSPVREPFLNFLIEIDWPNGHLLREYTVLLDPPVFMTKSTADTAESRPSSPLATESRPASSGAVSTNVPVPNIPVSTVAFQSASSKPAAGAQAAPAARSTFVPATQLSNNQQAHNNQAHNQAGSYRIKSGDTTWRLADAMRPNQSITVPQMMMAMLRSNPEAFINENINGLKRGYVLRVPDAEQITVLSKADAQAIVKEHWALWREYQQAKSSGRPVSALKAANNNNESTAAGTDGSDSNTSNNAHLAIVSAGADASGAGTGDPAEMTAKELRAELTLARERVETERVEKEALQSRINALEQNADPKNAKSSDGLLVVEDKGLSEMQSLNASNDAAADSTDTTGTEAADAESAAAQVTDGVTEGESKSDIAAAEMAAGLDEANTETTDTEQSTDAADAVFADEVAGEVAGEASADKATAAMPEKTESTDTTSEQPASEGAQVGPLAQLLNDPKMMAAAGGGLLLIVALIALMLKRRKSDEDDEPEVQINAADLETLADDIAEEATTADTVVAEQDVSSEAEEAEPEATVEAEAEEMPAAADASRDDVIAEADVYIAYGIYQQAEDLLNKAIAEKPDRIDYRVKLAETHHISKNATAFVEAATEIKSLIGDEASAEWNKVMVMGQDLCPDEALFEGEVLELDLDESLADGPVLELDDEDGSEESAVATDTDQDLTMDESLELPEFDTDGEAAEPVEELEFDIADSGAVEESDDSEGEFNLDIDAAELDIASLDGSGDDSVENSAEEIIEEDNLEEETMDLGDMDLGLDEDDVVDVTTSDASEGEVHELDDTVLDDVAIENTTIEDNDLEFDIDDIASAPATEVEEEVTDEASADDITTDEDSAEEVVAENTVTEMPVAEKPVAEEPAPEVKTIPAANDDSSDEGDFDLSSLDDVDEISTKLDLARAYLDMGDAEGTRGILEEVLIDGNDEQKQEANELLGKLA